MYQMSLEYLTMLDSKEVINDATEVIKKKTQKPNRRNSHKPKNRTI